MKSHSLPAILLCLLLAAWAPLAAQVHLASSNRKPGVILVGGDRNYPPYEFLGPDGEPRGYNVELTQAIARVMGLQVEFRLGHWTDAKRGLDTGQIDVLQGIVFSEERARVLEFTPPHTFVHQSLFARKGDRKALSFVDLKGKRVLVLEDGIDHEILRNFHKDVTPVPVKTNAEALQQLAAGHCDYALMAKLPGLYTIRELRLTNLEPIGNPILVQKYGYAVSKSNAALAATFSEGLAILKNTGDYQAIYDKWLGVLEPRGIPWHDVLWWGALVLTPLLSFLGLVSFWSWYLRRKVAARTAELTQEIVVRRRAEEELRRNHEQLVQAAKMAAVGVLASGVAHEINNPNGLILMDLTLLKDVLEDAAPILEAHQSAHGNFMLGNLPYSKLQAELPRVMDEALDASRRVKQIVEDLKDFGRKEDPDLVSSMSVNEVLKTSVRLLENLLRRSTSRLTVDCAEGLPEVRGNPRRMEQVVVNLIMNACQALPDRGRGIALRTFAGPAPGWVCLEVRDEGVGIPAEHLPHLTEPFFTTKREIKGTGLGLAVSAGIVKEHGGSMSFESIPGVGTIARIHLPAKEGPE